MRVDIEMSDTSFLEPLRHNPSDEDIKSIINIIRNGYQSNPEVAAKLASILANSGTIISCDNDIVADVASTGGPGSLSTIVTPLFLRTGGAIVPKLGVPGRPAGGVDCLAQIPNYKVDLKAADVEIMLGSGGYAHFLASKNMAPLDGRMFSIRQKMKAQAVPTLVCASILSKKLAVGVQYCGLDVRVSTSGNFGDNWEEATVNARLYIQVAELLGLKATPVLTDGTFPCQPYFGKRESLVALNSYFTGTASEWLNEHIELCRSLAMCCLPSDCQPLVASATASDLMKYFTANIIDQGSSLDKYNDVISGVMSKHVFQIVANKNGFCRYPIRELKAIIVEQQKAITSEGDPFPDPVGVVLNKRPGEWGCRKRDHCHSEDRNDQQ